MSSLRHAAVWQEVARARRDLADAAAALPLELWDRPSWCTEWRVRDVIGHVVGNAEGALVGRRALPGLLRHGGRVDAFLSADARARGSRGPAELVERLRNAADARFRPPGRTPSDVLTDVVVHTQDVLRPLGVSQHPPADALRRALSQTAPRKSLPAHGRALGLRLRATDTEWSWGDGPEVAGPALELLLALCGRAPALLELSGEGTAALAERMPTGASRRRPRAIG